MLKSLVDNHPKIFRGTFWRDTNKLVQNFIEKDTDLILDVGSHNAPYTKYLRNQIIAIDVLPDERFGFSDEIFEEFRGYENIKLKFASVEDLPFEDNFFDIIICTEVIEHVPDDESGISEMARVLKKTGKILLTTPNGETIPLEKGIEEHIRHYSEEELNSLLSKYFETVVIKQRFEYYNLLNLQYKFTEKYSLKNNYIWLFLALSSSWIYEIVYLFEKKFNKGAYNFVAICSNPKSDNKF